MSKKLLKKLSTIIGSSEEKSLLDPSTKDRLNTVLEDHLDVIAAAHGSVHGSHHLSHIK